MIAKPATIAGWRAVSTTLSASRTCQRMRAAPHAGLRPASTCASDIAASSGASPARAGSRRYAYLLPDMVRAASGEGVEDLLHVVILLETIDQREHLRRLFLGQLGRHGADVLVLGGHWSNAARFERLLQPAEVCEPAADHQLRLTFLAGALAHLLEAVIDQIQLEVVLIDPLRIQTEHAHLAEHEADTAAGGEIAAVPGNDVTYRGNRARRVVGGGLDKQGYTVRGVAFVEHFLVVGCVTARGALDGRLDLVLRHVDRAGVLDDPP